MGMGSHPVITNLTGEGGFRLRDQFGYESDANL